MTVKKLEVVMKKIVLLFLALLVLPTFAQKKLTLDKAISIALQRNSSLIKTRNNMINAKEQVKTSIGSLLPNLSASAGWSWNRISDNGGKQLNFFGSYTNIPPSKVDSRNYRLSAGGGVVLFDGLANYANIKKSKLNLTAARFALEKQKQDVVLKTTELYYAVLGAKELLRVRKEDVDYNKKQLETIELKNKLGSVNIADVYAQRVQLGNAQLALIQAKNNYEKAKSTLLNYLALDVLADYDFVDPYPGEVKNANNFLKGFKDVSTMVKEALSNRPDFKSQELVYQSRLTGITIAKGRIFPKLTGNYSFSTSATTPNDLFNRRVYNIGLSLNFPIFSNFNTEMQIEMAKVNAMNAREDLEILKRQIKIEIKQGYLDLLAAKKQLEVSIENVKAAGENRKINRQRYDLGSATILDVLQSDKNYIQAVQNKIVAEYEFYRLHDALLNSLGKLNIKNYE